MLKICSSKNIQNSKFLISWGVGGGNQNEEVLQCVPSRLLKSLNLGNNWGHKLIFAVNTQ